MFVVEHVGPGDNRFVETLILDCLIAANQQNGAASLIKGIEHTEAVTVGWMRSSRIWLCLEPSTPEG